METKLTDRRKRLRTHVNRKKTDFFGKNLNFQTSKKSIWP